jgi:hypothetical protein
MNNGIKWTMDQAKIEDCGVFQTDEGEPMAWAKAAYFGGMVSLKITVEDLERVRPHKGKMVSMSGNLHYEVKKGTGKESVQFHIGEIKSLQGK